MAAFVIGCSKSNTAQQPQAAAPQSTLEKLQITYQNQGKRIQEVEARLDALRQSYTTNAQPYLEQSKTLDNMISLHKLLYAKIQAEKQKIDAQAKAQGTE